MQMSGTIHCPHCRETLDGANSPAQTALMCPYCGELFSLGGGTAESYPAATGPATGVDTGETGYPHYVGALPRPAGITAVGVMGIIISGLMMLGVTCLGTVILAMDYIPELAEEMQKNMSEGESLPANDAGLWVGIVIMLVVGLAYLWASIGLLRRKEAARRMVWGISICGAIVTGIPLIYTWKEFLEGEALRENLTLISLFTYSIFVFIYLQRQVVKNWFAGRDECNISPPLRSGL
jgi:hypothetical protein